MYKAAQILEGKWPGHIVYYWWKFCSQWNHYLRVSWVLFLNQRWYLSDNCVMIFWIGCCSWPSYASVHQNLALCYKSLCSPDIFKGFSEKKGVQINSLVTFLENIVTLLGSSMKSSWKSYRFLYPEFLQTSTKFRFRHERRHTFIAGIYFDINYIEHHMH
jgi:hypothetical protein